MGFYIRDSIGIGPLRVNFSKSGLGFSFGVVGFRIGRDAKGRFYVHAGRDGLYYREHLDVWPEREPPAAVTSRPTFMVITGRLTPVQQAHVTAIIKAMFPRMSAPEIASRVKQSEVLVGQGLSENVANALMLRLHERGILPHKRRERRDAPDAAIHEADGQVAHGGMTSPAHALPLPEARAEGGVRAGSMDTGEPVPMEGERSSDVRTGEGPIARDVEAILSDAGALLGEAGALLRKARRLREELEVSRPSGAGAEAERLVHAAIAAGIETGLAQGLEAALRGLKDAEQAMGGVPGEEWLRRQMRKLE